MKNLFGLLLLSQVNQESERIFIARRYDGLRHRLYPCLMKSKEDEMGLGVKIGLGLMVFLGTFGFLLPAMVSSSDDLLVFGTISGLIIAGSVMGERMFRKAKEMINQTKEKETIDE